MPCGGIYPIKGSWVEKVQKNTSEAGKACWVCQKGDCDLFCDEWDTYIHSACVPAFLKTEEGAIVLTHHHSVIVIKDGQPHYLYEGD